MGKPNQSMANLMKKNTIRDTPEGRGKITVSKVGSLQNLPKYSGYGSKPEPDIHHYLPQKPLVSKVKKNYFENHKKLIQKVAFFEAFLTE